MLTHLKKLMIIKYPELVPAFPAINHNDEVSDCDFDPKGASFLSISSKHCFVHDAKTGETIWSIEKPVMHKNEPCEFRAGAFGRELSDGFLFLVINAKSRKRSHIAKWKVGSSGSQSWTLERSRAISTKPVTAFAMR